MASEYPGIQHIREGASGETVFLLNLLDTLYNDAAELEQQLREARADREYFVKAAQDYKAQADQARALLEDAVTHMMLTRTTESEAYQAIRAFLAQHKEETK